MVMNFIKSYETFKKTSFTDNRLNKDCLYKEQDRIRDQEIEKCI